LANKDAGFDSFAKSNFIGKQISLDWILKNPSHNVNLMSFQFDGRGGERRDAHARRPLVYERANEGVAPVSEAGCLINSSGEERGRVGNRLRPPHEDIRNLQMPIRAIGKLHVLRGPVIIEQTTDLPGVKIRIEMIDAGLLGKRVTLELNGLDRVNDGIGGGCIKKTRQSNGCPAD
jgi:hypothetical protein